MDLAALRAAAYDRAGSDSTDLTLTTAVMNRFVNAAVQFIETDLDWPWLKAKETLVTTAGVDFVTPGADWARTDELVIAPYVPLTAAASVEQLDADFDPEGRARPTSFAESEGKIYLRPVPDAVYSIVHRYVKASPALTDDAHTPLIPVRFHDAIAEVAAAHAARRVREWERADRCMASYAEWRRHMIDDRRRVTGPGKVRLRPR